MGVAFEATGIVAAHLYDFLTRYWPEHGGGRNIMPTPGFVIRLFPSLGQGRAEVKTYGTAFKAGAAPQASSSSSSWTGRGAGHRLGGD